MHIRQILIGLLLALIPFLPLEQLRITDLFDGLLLMLLATHFTSTKQALATYKQSISLILLSFLIGATFSISPPKSTVAIRDLLRATAAGAVWAYIVLQYRLELTTSLRLAAASSLTAIISYVGYLAASNKLSLTAMQSQLDTVANINTWGLTLALIANTPFCLALITQARPTRWGLYMLYALLYLAISWSYPSRGALLASLISCCFLWLLAQPARFQERRVRKLSYAVFLLGALAHLALFRIENFHYLDELSSWRLSLSQFTWREISTDWWLGHGPRTFKMLVGPSAKQLFGLAVAAPHNLLLEAIFSLGLIGSAVLAIGVSRLWPTSASNKSADCIEPIRLFGYAIFLQMLFHGMVDLSLFNLSFLSLLFIAGALLIGSTSPPADTDRANSSLS